MSKVGQSIIKGMKEALTFANGEKMPDAVVHTLEDIREKQMRTAEIDAIRAKLIQAEQSGFTDKTSDEILAKSKDELRKNGEL